jgi:hypothetical protein
MNEEFNPEIKAKKEAELKEAKLLKKNKQRKFQIELKEMQSV